MEIVSGLKSLMFQIKVKLEKTEGGALRLGKVVDPDELKKIIPYSII